MESRLTAKGVEGLSKKKKGILDMDNCVMIAEGEGAQGALMVMEKI